MAEGQIIAEGIKSDSSPLSTANKQKRRGVLSRIWNVIFRTRTNDFEKRLQHISKEEAVVLSRMKRRSHTWRRMTRHLIMFSLLFEVVAVIYAIMTTKTLDMNWRIRALQVLPIFLLPALSSAAYSSIKRFTKICDLRDQKALEKLRAERLAEINELKEKTNFYATQQLIQKYDPDPAAKAAAATVLASKLGADLGLKVYAGEELQHGVPTGKSNEMEVMKSRGLMNPRQLQTRSNFADGTITEHHIDDETLAHHSEGSEGLRDSERNQQIVVEHHYPQGSTTHDGSWISRIAALLVGEDSTQSYALICGNCHVHNGLARKEDFPCITYYCPRCHALNKPKDSAESASLDASDTIGSLRTELREAVNNGNDQKNNAAAAAPVMNPRKLLKE